MSKYIKWKDLYNALDGAEIRIYDKENAKEVGRVLEKVRQKIISLPTIEVSEDAIKWKFSTIADPNAEMGMRTEIEAFVEVSEDAISREDAVNALIAHFIPQTYTGEQVEQASKLARKIMANAPSVIPQPKEGEWQLVDHLWECDCCQYRQNKSKPTNYCPNCGSKMKGAEE